MYVNIARCVYRVCIVHEIVGVGGLFERGGLTRELRTLRGGWQTHVGGPLPVKARYEAPSLWMRKILRNTKSAEMELLQFCYMLLH